METPCLTVVFLLCHVSAAQCPTSPVLSVWAQRPCFLCSQVSPCQAPSSFPRKPFSACPGLGTCQSHLPPQLVPTSLQGTPVPSGRPL